MPRKKLTIEEMQKIAKDKEGKCLSKKYINRNIKLNWQCKEGHKWWATPNHIKWGTWCPICYGKHQTIKDMRKLARKKLGKCLSKIYINNQTKLKWQCKEGHKWEAVPDKGRKWCPICAGNRKQTIVDMQKIANNRGGKCLSKIYINNQTKLKWQCKEGHEPWETIPAVIKRGAWCPTCYPGVGSSEKICRKFFEKIFKQKFPCTRPTWLRTSKGIRLELDGYCEKIHLAFEYQGIQHYEKKMRFQNKRSFQEGIQRDKIKRELCKKQNVQLVEVPYTISYGNMEEYIKEKCRKFGIKIHPIKRRIDYMNFDISSSSFLKNMQKIANNRGGKCLSKKYINNNTKLLWQCKEGHEPWWATPDRIKGNYNGNHSGTWCPTCAYKKLADIKRGNIKDMQKIANNRGGKCLSKKYINNNTKLLWQCKKGDKWEATPNKIKRGTWCPTCAGKHQTIVNMRKLARERDGKCLSKKYINNNTKLLWQCKKGDTWETNPSNIKDGTWCPTCAGKHQTIVNMRKLARERDGKCLSKKYINAITKLRWQCDKGHRWLSNPNSIKNSGTWCPECEKRKRWITRKKYKSN